MQLTMKEYDELVQRAVSSTMDKLVAADMAVGRLESELSDECSAHAAVKRELQIAEARVTEAQDIARAALAHERQLEAELTEARRLLGEEQVARERLERSLALAEGRATDQKEEDQ